jgi:hypothetical protein
MKKIIFLSLVTSLIIGSCTQQEVKSPIEGTWQLVNGQGVWSDSTGMKTFEYPGNKNGNHWKIITKAHFATIYQDTTLTGFLTTGFNGGIYTFKNGIYTENFTHSSMTNRQLGTKLFFKAKIEGDKLVISPCSEDGKEMKAGNFEEYKRLD